MDEEIHREILGALSDRSKWDDRAQMFYLMRHRGLRRKHKPFPNASDAHYPLSDTIIEKLKPHYFQQLFAVDVLATFRPRKQQSAEFSSAAEHWFDYRLKQTTNLETEILTAIDYTLQSGRGILKTYWDAGKDKLCFEAVDPQLVVVPPYTNDEKDADWLCHIMPMSPAAFARRYNVSLDEAEGYVGRQDATENPAHQKEHAKYTREGLTYSNDCVIVWEVYTRDGDKWRVSTYIPNRPDVTVKSSYQLPYDHGDLPFTTFPYEIKDKGWYSPRGVPELVATYEAELNKLMNEKNDAMSFFNKPIFQSTNGHPNTGNLRFAPGQILPDGLAPVQFPNPPISFDMHLNMVREIAQQRVATPDFGLSQSLDIKERKTATEIQAIGNLFQQSSDLRMRIFRIGLAKLYRQAWSLLVQYSKDDLTYWYLDALSEAPAAAMHRGYTILPSGSADGVNKGLLFQKAIQRFQMFANDPFIDQGELRKSVLEIDDSQLVKRLYRNPDFKTQDQAEEQAAEIAIMRLGFPAQVNHADDHAVHVKTLMGYVAHQATAGEQAHPNEARVIQKHLSDHIEALRQIDKKAAKALEREIQNLYQRLAAQRQQSEQAQMEGGADVGQTMAAPVEPGAEVLPV